MNRIPRIVMILAVSMLTSCTVSDSQIEQKVSGALVGSIVEASRHRIKLLSWSEKGCEGSGEAAELNKEGRFELRRLIWRGGIGEIVQNDLLCLEMKKGYVPVFEEKYGPTPDHLHFDCLDSANGWKCEMVLEGYKPSMRSN